MVETSLELTVNENASYRPTLADVTTVTTAAEAKAALDVFLRASDGNRAPGFAGLPLGWFSVSGTPGAFDVTIPDAGWDAFTEYLYWTSQWVKGTPISTAQGLPAGLGKGGAFAGGEGLLFGAIDAPYAPSARLSDADRSCARRQVVHSAICSGHDEQDWAAIRDRIPFNGNRGARRSGTF